jgi:arginyl-tRNA--protein-N-Asp/Glu arginylyltransferase
MHDRGQLPQLLVYDDADVCAYLPDRTSRLLMEMPWRRLTRQELDQRLASGYRRTGALLYRTACPKCQACEALRVLVEDFVPNRTQRRVFRRGEETFRVEIGDPAADPLRVELYNRHKVSRDLFASDGLIDLAGYESFLVESCCETFELRYYQGDELIGVAVADRGQTAMSAVYCYFSPDYARLSLGTYSILKQLEFCRQWGLRHLYLGYYIAEPCRMTYKANFRPHERLIAGRWEASK